ncbi:MAG: hypothetical protein CMF55_05695 [Legionellales bacterium]|nr:hypothetical protein [Legionellales bacterium]
MHKYFVSVVLADNSYKVQESIKRGSVYVPYDIQLSLPLFDGIPWINKSINDSKSSIMQDFYNASIQVAVNHSDRSPSLNNQLKGTFVIKRNDAFKSIVVKLIEFHSPAAHPTYSLRTFNYDVDTDRCVKLSELFKDQQSLGLLATLSQKKLLDNNVDLDDQSNVFVNATRYTANNYQYWSVDQNLLTIYFWYTITGISDGQQAVTFSGQELASLLSGYGKQLLKV